LLPDGGMSGCTLLWLPPAEALDGVGGRILLRLPPATGVLGCTLVCIGAEGRSEGEALR
jgi:hypothetical protein